VRPGIIAFRRLAPGEVELTLASDPHRQLRLSSLTGTTLATASVLGHATNGTVIVLWEELAQGRERLAVRSFVGRFDATGQLIAGAEVPLAGLEPLAELYTTTTPNGEVFLLRPQGRAAVPIALPLTPNFFQPSGRALEIAPIEQLHELDAFERAFDAIINAGLDPAAPQPHTAHRRRNRRDGPKLWEGQLEPPPREL
jgi:hypothetical protein